ncbi:porin [Salipiger mangrovisoli]|uniref:porin n=1 Tax=Salipiger mangrovisoli TaxID=2865933 RepID=UPI0030B85D29
MTFGFDLSLNKANPEEGEDFDIPAYGLAMSYAFDNGISAGLYAERFTADSDLLLGTDVDFDSYGLSAGYARDTYKVQAFYGATTTDPEIDDIEIRDFGLMAAIAPTEQLTLSARYVRSTLEVYGESGDWETIELAGTYQINDPWAVFGGASFGSADDLTLDIDTYGFGVSYNLGAVTSVPATLSLELARTDAELLGEDLTADTVRLGVTFPLGNSGAKLPLNSVAGSVQNGRHSALSSSVLAAF